METKELDFIYNSNMIENIVYDRSLYDVAEADRKHALPEIDGHKKAFMYMKEKSKVLPTEKDILTMHKLLMVDLLDENNAGFYRSKNVMIAGHYGSFPVAIKPEMENLINMCGKTKTIADIWNCHNEFEIIHPFIDGNGRTGRLLLNWLMLYNKYDLHIVKHEKRYDYYNIIEAYRITRGE